MRKVYSMILAAVLSVLFVGNVNAGDRIPFTAENFTFYNYDGWGADANRTDAINGNFLIDEANGCPIGDTSCNAWVDLENYSKMYVTMEGCDADGVPNGSTPRIFINRSAENGQFNADKSQSACLVIPNGGWAAEYYSDLGNGTYEIDLEKILKDFGVVHFHSIKGSSWNTQAIVHSIEVEEKSGEKTGWISLISNGNLEGSDVTSFKVAFDAVNTAGYQDVEILDGVGVDGSRGIKISTIDTATEDWATQFFVALNEWIPEGTQYRMSFDYKASVDMEKAVGSGAHGEPRAWQAAPFFDPAITFASEWQHYTIDSATLPANLAGSKGLGSIAFDLNVVRDQVIDFYFDNFILEYYKLRDPKDEFSYTYKADAFGINLADNTNMKDLVKAAGGETLIFPNDCAKVTWDGKDCGILSVEGRPDGNLYIFIKDIDGDENADWDTPAKEVKVSFTNPTDPAFQVLYTRGQFDGQVMPDIVDEVCTWDEKWDDDIYSYLWGAPVLVSADPENGSFNLDPAMKQFTLKFNQDVDASTVVAKLGRETLTATAGETEDVVILTRTGSNELNGATEIHIDNVESVKGMPIDNPIVLKVSFGPVVEDENDQPEVTYVANFSQEGDDANGAGWIVTADAGGMQPANSTGGSRLQHGQSAFASDVLYLCQRVGTVVRGTALYGTEEDYKLTLAPKTYHLTLGAAQWDREDDRSLLVQVVAEDAIDTNDGSVLDESKIIASERKAIAPKLASKEAVRFDLTVPVEVEGNYVIRLVVGNVDGNPNGYADGCAIGDIKLEYIPATMGLVETKALAAALEAAKAKREESSDERYAGTAFTALDNLIKEYDGKTLTAPSVFAKATADLTAATQALNAHVNLCNEYDELPAKAFELYELNKDGKFNVTEYFENLKNAVQKYCTLSTEETINEETGEAYTSDVLVSFKLFYDDAELTAAKDELTSVIDLTSKMLTDEKSSNVWGHISTGYAVLHERLRRGVELLKSLGFADDCSEIVSANAELGDNDEIAEAIVKRANITILADLASGGSKFFAGGTIDENGEEVGPSYDLSVFVKNPNVYGPAYSIEHPGWTAVSGSTYAWSSWDGAQNHSANTPYPEDCSIHAGWHPSNGAIAQQTIENLPAGIYTIKLQCSDNNSPVSEGTCAFVKTSSTLEPEEGEELDPEIHYAGYVTGDGSVENVEVLDGVLTVGFNFGPGSQAFFNDVEIWLTKPLSGHDYTADYQNALTSVETAKVAPQVRAIEVYDLNGRRITKATKGLNILKKVMSDGSIKTEKVVR